MNRAINPITAAIIKVTGPPRIATIAPITLPAVVNAAITPVTTLTNPVIHPITVVMIVNAANPAAIAPITFNIIKPCSLTNGIMVLVIRFPKLVAKSLIALTISIIVAAVSAPNISVNTSSVSEDSKPISEITAISSDICPANRSILGITFEITRSKIGPIISIIFVTAGITASPIWSLTFFSVTDQLANACDALPATSGILAVLSANLTITSSIKAACCWALVISLATAPLASAHLS